ncbi:MAG: cellulase family glycosylhydrolase [Deltaproteobacteria bacterium]|nr:cellulase family glycosylhydrolase [Deltaproteobacteria bacterium]
MIASTRALLDALDPVRESERKHRIDATIPGPFTTVGDRIVDAFGRDLILRGVQHHALQDVDYKGREVRQSDYALMKQLGFTTLRLAISWSRLEPAPGRYDERYLREIKDALDHAQQASLFCVLEWHQDLYGRCTQEEDAPTRMNANGAPDWAGWDDIEPSVLAHIEAFDRFFANRDGRFDQYLRAWSVVADRFRDHPAVIGYDVLNEPQGTPGFETRVLYPAYRRTIAALKDAGARGLFFLDAPALRNETNAMATESMRDAGPGVVYAPHLYSGWLSLYVANVMPRRRTKAMDFAAANKEAQVMGVPWWNGEWAVNTMLDEWQHYVKAHVELEDHHRVGSCYWSITRAVPGQGDASISGGQALFDESYTLKRELVDILSRPYAIATPGILRWMYYDFGWRRLSLEIDVKNTEAPLILYAPARHLGVMRELEVQGSDYAFDFHPEQELVLVRFKERGMARVRLRSAT